MEKSVGLSASAVHHLKKRPRGCEWKEKHVDLSVTKLNSAIRDIAIYIGIIDFRDALNRFVGGSEYFFFFFFILNI